VRAHVRVSQRYHTKQGDFQKCVATAFFRLLVLVPPARAEHSGPYNLRDARLLSLIFRANCSTYAHRFPSTDDICIRHEFVVRRKKREKSMGFLIQYAFTFAARLSFLG
jgi:hypothetical protein